MSSKKKATAISLPLSRTAKIMTSAVGVDGVNQDIVALATKATEIFLTDFARRAHELSSSNVLEYDDIQRLVQDDPRYDFLIDTTPKKIKFSEALELIEANKKKISEQFPSTVKQQPQNPLESPVQTKSPPPSLTGSTEFNQSAEDTSMSVIQSGVEQDVSFDETT